MGLNGRVLFLEDDLSIREAGKRSLEKAGFRVVATDGASATYVRSERPMHPSTCSP